MKHKLIWLPEVEVGVESLQQLVGRKEMLRKDVREIKGSLFGLQRVQDGL
jgi:hypothetical protein